jgi:hypothetical protein
MSLADDALAFAGAPADYFDGSWYAMHHLERGELEQLQREALRIRFLQLHDRIGPLGDKADALGIVSLSQASDAVPLLFEHSVYKSYPSWLLLKARFGPLTRWLDRLTTHDLSAVHVDDCETIDEWLGVLDSETELRVSHSSGTTGTMSFFPRSASEWQRMMEALRCGLFQYSDPENEHAHDGECFDLIWPLFRSGRSAITRLAEEAIPAILGSPDRLHPLREGRMSSDGMYLAARLAAADARGEIDQLDISPALARRREEFLAEQQELLGSVGRFIDGLAHELAGRRVLVMGTWNVLYEMAQTGLTAGLEGVFDPTSVITTGGGAKNRPLPDNWQEPVKRFFGVTQIQLSYGMTEMTAVNRMCEAGRYHLEPWIVPFVLDPDTGAALPDEGEHTGRYAFVDLLPQSYWAGTITGDEVTLDRSQCRCGRTTAHLAPDIQRIADRSGEDDKITCAAADEAHGRALEFLTERLG